MNKGMKLATGDIIGIFNADDYYLSDSINVIAENHKEYSDCVLHGNMRVFSAARILRLYRSKKSIVSERYGY